MKHTASRVESAPSSVNSFGSLSDDGTRDLSMSMSANGDGNSNGKRRRRPRKGDKSRSERRGMDVKMMMTPVVKVLLFGVLLSFLDVLYIIKHLENASEEASEIMTPNGSSMAQTPSDGNTIKSNSNQSENYKQIVNKNAITNTDPLAEKGPIIKLIRDAGISFDPVEDADLIEELPKWSDVVNMYGPEPVIYGLNEGNCERFQAQTDKGDHFIGTAGAFNTGTNLMSELLLANCLMPDHIKKHGNNSRGIRWQVPWGKHSPAGDKEYRETHKTAKDALVDSNDIMPMVTIRDPLIWLKSMCRHKYTAIWAGFKDKVHCPNFLLKDLAMRVRYDGFTRDYESVLHLWNEYYEDYKNVNIPFLLVRFEDLVFHPEETITKVCECGGGMRSGKEFRYIVNSAKKGAAAHGDMKLRTGFVDALVKYGNIEKRYKDFHSIEDLKYVRDNINQSLMEMMQYKSIDPLFWNRSTENIISKDVKQV